MNTTTHALYFNALPLMTHTNKKRLAEALHTLKPWIIDAIAVSIIAAIVSGIMFFAFSFG
jgi:hypothetical protein